MAYTLPQNDPSDAYFGGEDIHAPQISSDRIYAGPVKLDPHEQIISDLATMGEHPDPEPSATLTDILTQIQDTLRKHLAEHLEKELVMGSEETVAPQSMYPEEVYEAALHKIAKGTCDCPSIDFGAKHSGSCPKRIAEEALGRA